jgi:hypothetical protein
MHFKQADTLAFSYVAQRILDRDFKQADTLAFSYVAQRILARGV